MKKSFLILFLVASVFFILPALSPSHAAGASGYSENISAYVAGSNALWSIDLHGANSTHAMTQAESLSGLTSYTLTAVKTSKATGDLQVFWRDGYGIVNLPFMPDQGIFLAVKADSSGTSDQVAKYFDDYLTAAFVQVSSTGGTTTYFSPIDFNNIAAPTLFRLVPSDVRGFASILTERQFLTVESPMIVLSATRGSSGFDRTISLAGASSSSVTQSDGRLLFLRVFGLTNRSISSSAVASSSTVDIHALDGFITSTDPAHVVNTPANLSGSYSLVAPLGRKISPNLTIAQDLPVLSATRTVTPASAGQGQTIAVTLTLRNTAISGIAQNIAVNDTWWKAYPGVFQLTRGSSSYKVGLIQPGKANTTTYVLTVTSSNKSELIIPPLVVGFNYAAGAQASESRTAFNQAEIRLNDVGPTISMSVEANRRSGSPLGVPTDFAVTVTNSGNGPALNLRLLNYSLSTLAPLSQGGLPWKLNISSSYDSLSQRNVTKVFTVQWQTQDGKTESLSSNTATVLYSHTNMVLPYIVASANATIPPVLGDVKSVNVTYQFQDRGKANSSSVVGALALPPGISCSNQNYSAITCKGDSLTIDYPAIDTKFPTLAVTSLNISKLDNYVVLPMNLTTKYMGLTLHASSSPFVLPLGLRIIKQFSPSSVFPGMSSRVSVATSNVGSRGLYNVSVTSPSDSFDALSGSVSANSKTFIMVTPQERYTFNYSVAIQNVGSGNKSEAPVIVRLIFAGLTQSIVAGQGTVQVLPLPSFTVSTSPQTPQEGNAFSASIVITNPSVVSIDGVHLVIPLPAGLDITNAPTGVSVKDQALVVDRSSVPAASSYRLNVSMKANTGVALDLSKSKLTFSYQGSALSGSVPSATISIKEDVNTRYVEPVILGLFVLLLFVVIIRRRAAAVASPPAPSETPQKKQP